MTVAVEEMARQLRQARDLVGRKMATAQLSRADGWEIAFREQVSVAGVGFEFCPVCWPLTAEGSEARTDLGHKVYFSLPPAAVRGHTNAFCLAEDHHLEDAARRFFQRALNTPAPDVVPPRGRDTLPPKPF